MDRNVEVELIDELLDLKARKSHFLDESVQRNPVSHYTSQERFDLEAERLFRASPTAVAHASEIANPGDFLRHEIAGQSVLITRDKAGGANAFLNVCRHRGTRLVDDESGCKHRFSCPYHAWTYSNAGDLIAAPHLESGFPDIDKSDLGLKRLDCQERYGFVWVTPAAETPVDLQTWFGDLDAELTALKMDEMVVAHQDVEVRRANWKILVEGGIEAYHFKVAHRATIGPHFEDNLSSYRAFGKHLRSVLPRTRMASLNGGDREAWRLRDHAQLLYTLFPSTQLLVQQDHIAWVKEEPISPDETRLRVSTLVPKAAAEDAVHWAQNHQITMTTLHEDFVIGESIQSSLRTGANQDMLFGRFEGALHAFNQTVEAELAD